MADILSLFGREPRGVRQVRLFIEFSGAVCEGTEFACDGITRPYVVQNDCVVWPRDWTEAQMVEFRRQRRLGPGCYGDWPASYREKT